MITLEKLKKQRESQYFMGFIGIDGPTPMDLCIEQINKLNIDYTDPTPNKILLPAAGFGTHGIILYHNYMEGLSDIFINKEERSRHILENILYLIEINPWLCRLLRKQGFINVIEGDYIEYEFKMEFDVVTGNPPFQKKVGPKKTEAIWPKHVQKCFDICKEGGYVSLIHPSGWRNVDGKFKETQKLLLSKDIRYLEMHNEKDGQEYFNATTSFDWYTVKNIKALNNYTEIIEWGGCLSNQPLNNLEFIPNGMFNEVLSLVAKDGEETVEVLYSRSAYGTDKSHMSKVRTEEHIYPCVYTTLKDNTINLMWSNTNSNGHFGIPKVIWSNGMASSLQIDLEGNYGLTQFSYAIVDEPENLLLIKKVMESNIFLKLIKNCYLSSGDRFSRKILATFRKDFWEDFLDEDNNVIEPNYNVERV